MTRLFLYGWSVGSVKMPQLRNWNPINTIEGITYGGPTGVGTVQRGGAAGGNYGIVTNLASLPATFDLVSTAGIYFGPSLNIPFAAAAVAGTLTGASNAGKTVVPFGYLGGNGGDTPGGAGTPGGGGGGAAGPNGAGGNAGSGSGSTGGAGGARNAYNWDTIHGTGAGGAGGNTGQAGGAGGHFGGAGGCGGSSSGMTLAGSMGSQGLGLIVITYTPLPIPPDAAGMVMTVA